MKIKVFGRLQEICGTSFLEMDKVKSVSGLKHDLEKKFPALKEQRYLVSKDKVLTSSDDLLSEDSEVALMPPYSGG